MSVSRRLPLKRRQVTDVRVGRDRSVPPHDPLKGKQMQPTESATALRIYTDEMALVGDHPLHEVVLAEARAFGLAGATVFRALGGFGQSTHRHTHHVSDLASDVPLVIEIIDRDAEVRAFLAKLTALEGVGLITLSSVEVVSIGRSATRGM